MSSPRRKSWSPQQIRAALVRRGIKQVDVAAAADRRVSTLNDVIVGRTRSRHLRTAIAGAIGVPVERIWPEEAEREDDPAVLTAA